MVLRSTLDNWTNGNFSCITRDGMFELAKYFEYVSKRGYDEADELIKEDELYAGLKA